MYTTLDKAIVALVMSIIGLMSIIWRPLDVSPEIVASIVGFLTPLLVYLWPNAPKDKA